MHEKLGKGQIGWKQNIKIMNKKTGKQSLVINTACVVF